MAAKLLRLYENTTSPDSKRQCLEMITSLTLPGSVQKDDVTTYDLISVDDLPNRRSETKSAFQRRTFDGWTKKCVNTHEKVNTREELPMREKMDETSTRTPALARVKSSSSYKSDTKMNNPESKKKRGAKIRRAQSAMSMTSMGRGEIRDLHITKQKDKQRNK